jgi:hypothetical protein
MPRPPYTEVTKECENCTYFHGHHSLRGAPSRGECRKNAPTPGPERFPQAVWPEVSVRDFCGEWRRRPAETEEG